MFCFLCKIISCSQQGNLTRRIIDFQGSVTPLKTKRETVGWLLFWLTLQVCCIYTVSSAVTYDTIRLKRATNNASGLITTIDTCVLV